ncbi:unnamed protein product [Thelazia callipaeda]|uniref:RING-type domain-containing protein n=1 Tax=Thelazia callipaeda TaxID=103827 RepID=A0A0N5D030_THECL|nr:unnamed protein product [Thelazia callipaeda]
MGLRVVSVNCKIFWLLEFAIIVMSLRAQYVVEVWEPKPDGYDAVLQCDATGADFGGGIPSINFNPNDTGCAYFTRPEDSCTDTFNNRTGCVHYYAVVPRGNCSFSEKAYHAQRGYPDPYSALIIFNSENHSPVPMAGGKYADRVIIPVVMITYTCMTNIMDHFPAHKGYRVALRAIPGYYDLVKYLIPLVAIVAFCFVVLCISLTVRLCRERRHLARKRLSKRNLKKLPTKRFKKGEAEDSCAICIDEFIEGEKLRVLPCSHAYHCKCIDPWLTKIRKVCPICKRKVLSTGESDSSDSENERRDSTSASGSATLNRENAPLLRNAEPVLFSFKHRNGISSTNCIVPPSGVAVPIIQTNQATGVEICDTSRIGLISNRLEAVSKNIRRTLRPCYQQMVHSSTRAPRRNEEAVQSECVPEPRDERPFAVDNHAFDVGNETFAVSLNTKRTCK